MKPRTPTGKRLAEALGLGVKVVGAQVAQVRDILAIEREAAEAVPAYVRGWDGGRIAGRAERDALADQLAEALKWQHIDGHTGGCVFEGEPPRCTTLTALAAYKEMTNDRS